MKRGAKIEKVKIITTPVRNKQKGIAKIEEQIMEMLQSVITTLSNINTAIKNNDLELLAQNSKIESILTLQYYDLLEQVNYYMTAYSMLAKTYRRCIGAIYLSSDILDLIRKVNLIVILSTKAITDAGNLLQIIILMQSVVHKIKHFAKVYQSRKNEEISANIQEHTTFRRKWHKQRDLLVTLLQEQKTASQTKRTLNILTIIHEIRSIAFITIKMYERLLYIERGKIYHLTNDNF